MKCNARDLFQRIARGTPWLSGALLIAFAYWLYTTASSRDTLQDSLRVIGEFVRAEWNVPRLSLPVYAVCFGITFSILTNALLVIRLFWGQSSSRSLQSWLLCLSLLCGWLALATGWKDVYWYGQAKRITTDLGTMAELATDLLQQWPKGDGDHPAWGMLLCYPKSHPTILLLAGEPKIVGELQISAIEKSTNNTTLRFQLAGQNHSTWLVYHAKGLFRSEFTNDFQPSYLTVRTQTLTSQWQMMRVAPTLNDIAEPW